MNSNESGIVSVRFICCLALALAGAVYLIWWYRADHWEGIYDDHLHYWPALAVGMVMAVTGLYSLFRIKIFRGYAFIFFIVLLSILYVQGVFESRTVLKFKGCDMSVCNTLKLKRNGTFELRSAEQSETRVVKGHYFYSGKQLYLSRDTICNNDSEYLKLKSFNRKQVEITANFEYYMLYGI